MTCQECGRPAENGQPTHWVGCEFTAKAEAELDAILEDMCEFPGCDQPRKAWSGRGAKPKYCEEHSDPKNRK